MVLTISPSVEGAHKSESSGDATVVIPFIAGASVSGAAVFGLFGALGGTVFGGGAPLDVSRSVFTIGIAVIAAAYGVSYLSQRPLPLRHTYRQVPKVWREAFSRRVAALLYGFGLGVGLFTKVPYVTFYVALALAFATASPASGVVAGAAFGLARSAPLVVFTLKGVPLGTRETVTEGLTRLRPRIDAVNGLALCLGSLVLVISVL